MSIAAFQTGKEILNLKETQLEDLVKKVYSDLKVQADIKKLKFELKLPENPLPKIKVDPERMIEVFSNLIDNAIKYTNEGKIEIELKKERDSILFLVKDTGIGIPPEELPIIGQSPFERGKEGKKVTLLGKGIGLYLSRLIVKAHRGKIWAESGGKGKGSTFYVELPIR